MRALIASTLLLAGALIWGPLAPSGASPGPAPALPEGAVVTYSFTDSSVPPQYHRSWRLTVTPEQSAISVFSYGSVLAERAAGTAPGIWDQLSAGFATVLASAESAGLRGTPEGCTGGTTEAVRVTVGPEVLVDQSVYDCGGINTDIAEALRAWIAPARLQFPATDVLAPPG